jgi:hypothetical protein
MDDGGTTSLPVGLAIRLLLDSTSYSNPVPEWFEPLSINYRQRENRLRMDIGTYLNGGKPAPVFEIPVPKKAGGSNLWVVPSVNDQIICQAAVSALARRLQSACVDPTKVFSCLLNSDPSRVSLFEAQVTA